MRLSPAVRYAGGRVLRAAATPRGAAQWLRDRAAYQQLPGAERAALARFVPQAHRPAAVLAVRSALLPPGRVGGAADRRAAPGAARGRRLARRSRGLPDGGDRGDVRRHPAAGGRHRGPDADRRQRAGHAVRGRRAGVGQLPARGRAHRARALRRPARPAGHAQGGGGAAARARARRPAAVLAPGRTAARGLQRAPRARPGARSRRGSTGSSWPSSRAWTTRACSGATARRRSCRARPTPAACIS